MILKNMKKKKNLKYSNNEKQQKKVLAANYKLI